MKILEEGFHYHTRGEKKMVIKIKFQKKNILSFFIKIENYIACSIRNQSFGLSKILTINSIKKKLKAIQIFEKNYPTEKNINLNLN